MLTYSYSDICTNILNNKEDNYKSRKFYEKMGGILWKDGHLEIKGTRYPIVSYLYKLN